jgi:hypothetical protein
MVVVMDQRLDGGGWPRQSHLRPDENKLCPRSNEAVHEILGASPIDLPGSTWSEFKPVTARVVDVDIHSVLVRRVAETPKALSEITAVGSA